MLQYVQIVERIVNYTLLSVTRNVWWMNII